MSWSNLFLLCAAHGTGALMELKVRESEHSQVFTKRGSFVRWSAQWTVIERRGTEDDDSFTLNAP